MLRIDVAMLIPSSNGTNCLLIALSIPDMAPLIWPFSDIVTRNCAVFGHGPCLLKAARRAFIRAHNGACVRAPSGSRAGKSVCGDRLHNNPRLNSSSSGYVSLTGPRSSRCAPGAGLPPSAGRLRPHG